MITHVSGQIPRRDQTVALWASTISFTVCFAVWTIFSIIGLQIQKNLGLNETQFGLLVGTPILTGSLIRIFLGIWTEQYGGRRVLAIVMALAAVATWLLTFAETYPEFLVAALGVGLAGGSFAVGVTYVSHWFPPHQQGTALGVFGAGNIGSAVTKFCAPFVMVALGWEVVAQVWAAVLLGTAVVFWFLTKDEPILVERRSRNIEARGALLQIEPLRKIQVWRFSLYYFFVFGGFVALALWLPRYLIGVYALPITTAGMIAAFYSVPGSLFRIFGGWLSDRFGARRVMYWTFGVSLVCTVLLSLPNTHFVIQGIHGEIDFTISVGLPVFMLLIFVLGFFMSLGKAAVYKHVPVYYPDNVGSVGGVVGMMGGLGGFILPIVFGALNDWLGIWTSCFMLLSGIVALSLLWMHIAIRGIDRRQHPGLSSPADLPEFK